MELNFRSTCPLSNVLDIFGDKWSLLIIRDLLIGRNTFSDLLEAPEKIATNILVDRLKRLVSFGIIDFKRKPSDKKVKIYHLTSKGQELYPILVEMTLWSRKNLEVDFHPLSYEVFNEIDEIGVSKHIFNVLDNYKGSIKDSKETLTI